jgi:GxxExxY protein
LGFVVWLKPSLPVTELDMAIAIAARPSIHRVTGGIVSVAMKVHSALGPGLLENAYEACLCHEPRKEALRVESQVTLPAVYDGVTIDLGYLLDLVVESVVVVELKSVESINPVHKAQLLSYLKLSGTHVGLLINFNVAHLPEGITRLVNGRGWESRAGSPVRISCMPGTELTKQYKHWHKFVSETPSMRKATERTRKGLCIGCGHKPCSCKRSKR